MTSNKMILLVDDQNENIRVLGSLLQENNYSIAVARDGTETFKVLDEVTPDLILLDVMMPGENGFEVCRRIKAHPEYKDLPIIFLTALNATNDIIEGFESGGVDYITKPINRKELLVRVRNHLDLSESKKTIALQSKKLEDIIRSREKLYSVIAHDIRSPLTAIQMLIREVLGDEMVFSDESSKNIFTLINKATDETLSMLENLLMWAKSQSGQLSGNPEHISMHAEMEKILGPYRIIAQSKKIEIQSNLPENTTIWFDKNSFHTVIRNLISNALKFTPEYGEVSIASLNAGGYTQITVKDSGMGMSEEIIRSLQKKELLSGREGTNKEKGSGIGLFLCQELCEMNGSKLTFTSSKGKGSTIYLTIPNGTKKCIEKKCQAQDLSVG